MFISDVAISFFNMESEMADSSSDIAVSYPIPVYRFRVSIGEETLAFNNVSGMSVTYDTAQYVDGMGGTFNMPAKRPTQVTVTLTKGMFKGQSVLYDWLNSITFNRVDKKDVSISLTDEAGVELLVTWNLFNAFPTTLGAPTLDASSNEVAIESLTLVGDRISVQYH